MERYQYQQDFWTIGICKCSLIIKGNKWKYDKNIGKIWIQYYFVKF
jgi:hypothetical protein